MDSEWERGSFFIAYHMRMTVEKEEISYICFAIEQYNVLDLSELLAYPGETTLHVKSRWIIGGFVPKNRHFAQQQEARSRKVLH